MNQNQRSPDLTTSNNDYPKIPLDKYREYPIEEMRDRLEAFYADIDRRRTVRDFSDRPPGAARYY
jgi:hypothetical protein